MSPFIVALEYACMSFVAGAKANVLLDAHAGWLFACCAAQERHVREPQKDLFLCAWALAATLHPRAQRALALGL